MRKLIVVLAVLGVTAAGTAASTRAGAAVTTASSTVGTTAASTASIAWGACSDPNLKQLHAQCGFLKVPLDYSKPNGAKISIAVSRILHTSPASRDTAKS